MNKNPVELGDATESPKLPTFWRAMPLKPFKVCGSSWCVVGVLLAVVGMLVVFYSVVRGATTAGELRRQDTAAQAAAVTRCLALPNGANRTHCPNSPIVIAAR